MRKPRQVTMTIVPTENGFIILETKLDILMPLHPTRREYEVHVGPDMLTLSAVLSEIYFPTSEGGAEKTVEASRPEGEE